MSAATRATGSNGGTARCRPHAFRMRQRIKHRKLHRRHTRSAPRRCRRRTRRTNARCSADAPRLRSDRTDSPNRKCASITSSALFASVALSMVILRPIVHVGCLSASASVACSSWSSLHPRNGPPEAVRITRRTSLRRAASDALKNRAVLAVHRDDLAAALLARLLRQRARNRPASPCSRARRACPRASAASVASSPAAPTTALSTMSRRLRPSTLRPALRARCASLDEQSHHS